MIVPVFDRELTGNKGRGNAVTLLDNFEELPSFRIAQRGQPQVIEDKQMRFGEFLHETSITAIGPSYGNLVEELREAEVEGPKALTTGVLSKSTSEEGFSDSGRATDEKVLMSPDPVTGDETGYHRFLDSSGGLVINVLDAGLKFKFGVLEEAFEPFVLLPGPLAVHEHTQAFLEREIVEGGLL
jgi:hypothetical protein